MVLRVTVMRTLHGFSVTAYLDLSLKIGSYGDDFVEGVCIFFRN
jgi:hypothetical protein